MANQFTVIENNQNKRPDVILFVNGIPLVVMELKNAADENATIKSAWQQIETYKQAIPGLFTYNALLVSINIIPLELMTFLYCYDKYMKFWGTLRKGIICLTTFFC